MSSKNESFVIKPTKDGKYLDYFENLDDAMEFLESMARKYRHHPHPERISVTRLCKRYEKKGIRVTLPVFLRYLNYRNIKIRNYRPGKKNKKFYGFTIDRSFGRYLKNFHNKSRLAETALKIAVGFPTTDVIMYLPPLNDDPWSNKVAVIFQDNGPKSGIMVQIAGYINSRDEILIRSLTEKANEYGLKYVIEFCETHGYLYVGGELLGDTEYELGVDTYLYTDSDDNSSEEGDDKGDG